MLSSSTIAIMQGRCRQFCACLNLSAGQKVIITMNSDILLYFKECVVIESDCVNQLTSDYPRTAVAS